MGGPPSWPPPSPGRTAWSPRSTTITPTRSGAAIPIAANRDTEDERRYDPGKTASSSPRSPVVDASRVSPHACRRTSRSSADERVTPPRSSARLRASSSRRGRIARPPIRQPHIAARGVGLDVHCGADCLGNPIDHEIRLPLGSTVHPENPQGRWGWHRSLPSLRYGHDCARVRTRCPRCGSRPPSRACGSRRFPFRCRRRTRCSSRSRRRASAAPTCTSTAGTSGRSSGSSRR